MTSSPHSDDLPTQSVDLGRRPGAIAHKALVGEQPGDVLGPYTLRELIGEGGFGSVFLAQQDQPLKRSVALKLIKLGMDTKQVIARFEAERQALAVMDHPHIAKVLDAGATPSGRPYFVMELVKGEPIVRYCDSNRLTIAERIELFSQVCGAVQHAHTKGIIHRDIKPSNVLVSTSDGRPHAKVIDFGIAKATAAKLTERTVFTEQHQLIGTPEYMSPEQAEGSLDIDTRTDVYSLGVLLYELLTGSTPFSSRELRSAAYAELLRIIRQVEPPRPSTRLSRESATLASVAASRQTEPRRLTLTVRGELDWVVMKALEKDRNRRYESPGALADDLRRYMAGEAVSAAPPSSTYRLRAFVRQHKGAVFAAGLIATALVLGIAGTSFGLVRAEAQRRLAVEAQRAEASQKELAQDRLLESEATVDFLAEMLAAADPSQQGKDVTVRSVADRAAERLASAFADRPVVAARLHATLAQTYFSLGEYAPAERHAQQTLELRSRAQGAEAPDTCRARNALASLLVKQARFDEAQQMLVKALADHERLFGREHDVTVETIDALAQLYLSMGRVEEATSLTRELLSVRTASRGPEHIETISAMNTLGILLADSQSFDEAEGLYEQAISTSQRALGDEHPLTLELRGNFAWVLYQAAAATKQENPDRASSRFARARTLGEQVLAARTRILGEDHPETGNAANNLAAVYRELGLWDQADALGLKDIEMSVRVLGEQHPDTIVSIANMGNSLRMRKRYDEAVVYLDRALKNARVGHPPDFPGTAFILGWYGSCLRDMGRFTDAEPMLLEARGIAGRAMGEDHPIVGEMNKSLVMLYADWDRAEPGKAHGAKADRWRAPAEQPAPNPGP